MTSKQQANWSPYNNNGGMCVAIARSNYCVIAADMRLSTGYSILTRDYSKLHKLADKSILASSRFQADIKALQKHLSTKHLIYQHQHNKQMSYPGCVFTYDAVGSYERVGYSSQGSGSTLITPVLDNQLKSPSPLLIPRGTFVTPLSETEAVDLVKDVFTSAPERDIYTGDRVEITIVNAARIRQEYAELRKE
ncbi:hypothetical protein IFM89_022914 [Coptis chinensis]|uniref:Proteasome subunit beta n=1 Tax=Coptis chinensis TaxID=261450 RepID=A0A835IM91_9MAGN|nr:hypothetical protein IFM89_022914 [Coptis chinensis]